MGAIEGLAHGLIHCLTSTEPILQHAYPCHPLQDGQMAPEQEYNT